MLVRLLLLVSLFLVVKASAGAGSLVGGSVTGSGTHDITGYTLSGSSGTVTINTNSLSTSDPGSSYVSVEATYSTTCLGSLQVFDTTSNTVVFSVTLSSGGSYAKIVDAKYWPTSAVLKLRVVSPSCSVTISNTVFTLHVPVTVA